MCLAYHNAKKSPNTIEKDENNVSFSFDADKRQFIKEFYAILV
jgi:hypothetical protein